jgi:hypothetical protein
MSGTHSASDIKIIVDVVDVVPGNELRLSTSRISQETVMTARVESIPSGEMNEFLLYIKNKIESYAADHSRNCSVHPTRRIDGPHPITGMCISLYADEELSSDSDSSKPHTPTSSFTTTRGIAPGAPSKPRENTKKTSDSRVRGTFAVPRKLDFSLPSERPDSRSRGSPSERPDSRERGSPSERPDIVYSGTGNVSLTFTPFPPFPSFPSISSDGEPSPRGCPSDSEDESKPVQKIGPKEKTPGPEARYSSVKLEKNALGQKCCGRIKSRSHKIPKQYCTNVIFKRGMCRQHYATWRNNHLYG